VAPNDLDQSRQQPFERGNVAGQLHVPIEGVKEPERRIRGVVQGRFVSLGEEIRDEAVTYVVRERPEDITRLEMPARHQGEPLEADHGVAPPVGEPVIAGYHAPDLVAGGPGARRILHAADRRDDELVGRQHQLRRESATRLRHRRRDQPPAPLVLGRPRGGWLERSHGLPTLYRCHQGGGVVSGQVQAEVAGAPQLADSVIAAPLLDAVQDLLDRPLVDRERRGVGREIEPKRRQRISHADLVSAFCRGHDRPTWQRFVHGRVM
jgi:hypothetical protein